MSKTIDLEAALKGMTQVPSQVYLHPSTSERLEEAADLIRAGDADPEQRFLGFRIRTTPVIPENRAVMTDHEGNILNVFALGDAED